MPRWLLPALAVSVLVLLAVAVKPILLPAGNLRLTKENFERIERGMRREEVEAILGPPGDYRTGPTSEAHAHREILSIHLDSRGPIDFGPSFRPTKLNWEGDEARIKVELYYDGTVYETDHISMESDPVGLLDLLRWRWERWRESRR